MSGKPEIFISCVSGEFRSTRQLVANALLSLGYMPVFQEIFGTEGGDLRQVLREKIDSCQGLIQIIGDAYGAEPPTIDPDYGRVSYTQFEFLYARLRGIKRIVFFAQPGCDRDAVAAQLDLPRDGTQGDPAEYQAERRALQAAYRAKRMGEEALYYEARNTDHLMLMVHTIKAELAELRAEDKEWRAGVSAKLDAMVQERRSTQGAIREGFAGTREKLDTISESQARQHAETKQDLGEIRKRLESVLSSSGSGGAKVLLRMQALSVGEAGQQQVSIPAELSTPLEAECVRLLAEYRGFELDKSDGALFLFERPINAVAFAIALQGAWQKLRGGSGSKAGLRLAAHLGEVHLRDGPAGGEKVVEVDGFARQIVSKVLATALPGQTLITRSVFDLARQATAAEGSSLPDETRWITHGVYFLKGIPDSLELFEAGVKGQAPLTAPPDSSKARRSVSPGEADLLGWRPFPGVSVPGRANWRVVRKLGEGGFGEAWLVEQPKSKQRSVYKFCFDSAHLASLKREMTLLRALNENVAAEGRIAKVLDWSLESPPHFLELQFYEAGSLVNYAESLGGMAKMPLVRRLEFLTQIADGLSVAHRQGILHRDVKPSNILVELDKSGKPRALLGDFGIGAVLDRQILAAKGITGEGLTTSGRGDPSSGGTRLYTAPELLEGGTPSPASDVYSFGVTMYQVVVGDLHQAIGHGWADKIRDSSIRDLIALCIYQDPSKRIQDIGVVYNRLRALSSSASPSDSSATRPAQKDATTAGDPFAKPSAPGGFAAMLRRHPVAIAIVLLCALAFGVMSMPNLFSLKLAVNPVQSPAQSKREPVAQTPSPVPKPTPVPKVEPNPNRVTLEPARPVPGESVRITYSSSGTDLENVQRVYIHYGVNGWASPGARDPRPAMAQVSPNVWQADLTVEEYAWQLDLVFMDGEKRWDKNGGLDWLFPTTVPRPDSTKEQEELGARLIEDAAALKDQPNRGKVRSTLKLVSFFEGVEGAHPALMIFVDAKGHQLPAVYGPKFAELLKGAGIRPQLGASYDIIGWKSTYRDGPQVGLEVGGRMAPVSPASQTVGWEPPKVPINQLQQCDIWSLALTRGALMRDPTVLSNDPKAQRWLLVDPNNRQLQIPVRVFAGADFTRYFPQYADKIGDFVLYVRRGQKKELEVMFMMLQHLKGQMDPDPSMVPRVALSPHPPMRGRELTISYRSAGTTLEKSNPVFIELGYDGWKGKSDRRPIMVQYFPGVWQHTMTVPSDVMEINFVFTDWQGGDSGNWDRNGGKEWAAKTVPPPTPTPGIGFFSGPYGNDRPSSGP